MKTFLKASGYGVVCGGAFIIGVRYRRNKIINDTAKNDPEGYEILRIAEKVQRGALFSPQTVVWYDELGNYWGPDKKNQDKLCRDIEFVYPQITATCELTGHRQFTYTISKDRH